MALETQYMCYDNQAAMTASNSMFHMSLHQTESAIQ